MNHDDFESDKFFDKEEKEIIETLDEKVPYSFDEILNYLQQERTLLLTIPQDQEEDLKAGLQARKGKVNQLMKRKGIEPPKETLSFTSYPAKGNDGKEIEGIVQVRVSLKERASVDIIRIERPTDEF